MVVVTRSMKKKADILSVNTEMIYKNSESLKNIYKNKVYYKYNYNGRFYGLKFEDLEEISYNKYFENYKIDDDNYHYNVKVALICKEYEDYIEHYGYDRHTEIQKLSNIYGILIWVISQENIKYTFKLSNWFKVYYDCINSDIQDLENDLRYTREHPIYNLFDIYKDLYEKMIHKINKIQIWYKSNSNRNKMRCRVTFIKYFSKKGVNNDIIDYILNL